MGFNAYKAGSTTEQNIISTIGQNFSDRPVDIMKIQSIFLKTKLTLGSGYVEVGTSLIPSNYIHQFFPKVGPGVKIVEEPASLI